MALTNTQYNTIMRVYEQRQTKNRHLSEDRLNFVYANVKRLPPSGRIRGHALRSQGKKMLNGDPNALSVLKGTASPADRDKKELLRRAGLPDDYLEPVYDCPDCHDTGYVDGRKCHCFRQAEIALLYQQSNLKEVLQKENFDTLSYEYFDEDSLPDFRAAVQKCRDFAASFDSSGRNLFFYGTVGTGKTFLSNCIAREVIESGHSVIYFSASMLFDTLSRNAFDYKRPGYPGLFI